MNHQSGFPRVDDADIANYYGAHVSRPRVNNGWRPHYSPYRPIPTSDQDQTWPNIPLRDIGLGIPTSSRDTSNDRSCQSSSANLTQTSVRLVPILPPPGAPPLNFRPICLRPVILWVNAAACLILAGLIFAVFYGVGNDHQAILTSENAHILTTYCPALIATINLMCFRVTFFEYFRILPYTRMADQKGQITVGASAAKSLGGSYFPWLFASYSDDPWLKGISQFVLFAVGFLTTFKSVFLGSQETKDGWILTVHARPSYYLVGAYSTMAVFYITLWLITKDRCTGLKWDPAAPCDHLALVWRTNAMSQVAQLPINHQKAYTVLRSDVKWRIGYWRRYDKHADGSQSESVIHGIGMLEEAVSEPCKEEGTCTCRTSGRCTFSRRMYPPMSRPAVLSAFLITLLVFTGFCVYIVAKGIFINGQELSGSWLKLNSTYISNGTDADSSDADITNGYVIVAGQVITAGDSTTANILFRAFPTYVAGLYAPYFDGMEIRLRDITWISALAGGPQPSSKSLALDYATQFSFVVPVTACEHRHFRLGLIAFVNTFAPLFPVFVAGMVIFERRSADHLHLIISKASFIIVCIYLLFFLAATVAAWPRKTELLLRPFFSIADLVKPFAHSWLLEEDTTLDSAMSERTRERFRAKVLLAEYCYQLGITKGTCGKLHRGIDIVGNELGDRYRSVVPANKLIREMRMHRKGKSDDYSRLEAGMDDIQQIFREGAGARSG